jgi:hypothetical protein
LISNPLNIPLATPLRLTRAAAERLATIEEDEMSFALYMIGFIVFMGGMVWAAVVAEVPHLYIGLAVLVLFGFGVLGAIGRRWIREPHR